MTNKNVITLDNIKNSINKDDSSWTKNKSNNNDTKEKIFNKNNPNVKSLFDELKEIKLETQEMKKLLKTHLVLKN